MHVVLILNAGIVFIAGPSALAELVGGPDIIPPPESVIDDPPGATNTRQQAFNERQNVVLPRDISIDGGVIPAGTIVSSHMIFLNTIDAEITVDLDVQWTFRDPIVGVMSDSEGRLEGDSNDILGAPGTIYPVPFPARGMEHDHPKYPDAYQVVAGSNEITVSMQVAEPGDWIRVLTSPVSVCGASGPNFVTNGSFEIGTINPNPPNPNFPYFETLAAGAMNIAKWTVVNGTVDYSASAKWQGAHGDRSLDMDGLTFPGSISQEIATVPGEQYELKFYLSGNPAGPPLVKDIRACAATKCRDFEFSLPLGEQYFDCNWVKGINPTWIEKSLVFTATDPNTAIRFTSLTTGENCKEPGSCFMGCNSWGPLIDNVSVSPVCGEPVPKRVWAGARYDAAGRMLEVSARATDPNSGLNVTSGSASYSIPALSRFGPMVYGAERWEATVDFSGDPPPPGNYVVNVHIAGGLGQASFHVPGLTGTIRGTVYDVGSQPFEGVTVSLHESIASLDVALMETVTDASGAYELSGVSPGWHTVAARAEGYLVQDRTVRVQGGQVVEQDFSLTSTRTLRQLDSRITALYQEVRGAMNAGTKELSDMTGQAADHFKARLDAWEIASAVSGLLHGAIQQLGPEALRHIAQQGLWLEAARVLEPLILRQAIWLFGFELHELIVADTVKSIIPDDADEWRQYSQAHLQQRASYSEGEAALVDAYQEYLQVSQNLVVADDFRFERARLVLEDMRLQVHRIREGEPIRVLVPPQDEPAFLYTSFPTSVQLWKLNHVLLSFVSHSKKIAITIALLADGATLLGLGTTFPVTGTISAGTHAANLILSGAEVPLSWLGGLTYAMNVKAWSEDMLTLPEVFTNTWDYLKQEAADPTFLSQGESYALNVTFDLQEHGTFPFFGVPFIVTDGVFSILASSLAEIKVTNTGTLPSRVRAAATGSWDARLPGNVPLLGSLFGNVSEIRVPVATASSYVDLEPGQSSSLFVPYHGILIEPTNAFRPHWFRAEVYSGPFQVSRFETPYFVLPGASTSSASSVNAPPFRLTFVENGETDNVPESSFGSLVPIITQIAETTLTPESPFFETVFDASDFPSVEFDMHSDAHGVVELRVCNKFGHCVGYDSTRDGVVTEFPAQYSGNGSTRQSVYLPAPGAEPYTVRAVLTGAFSAEPVGVTLWALETPVRPAVMGVSPAAYMTRLYWDETATVPLSVAEAGGQVPLTGVTVAVGELIGADGTSTLNVLTGGAQSFSLIPAGSIEDAEVHVQVPRGVPFGPYGGTIAVESENAGSQEVQAQVVVLPMGDFDADEHITLDDVQAFVECIKAPNADSLLLPCRVADYDGNQRIDMLDVAKFQRCFSGAEDKPYPNCAQ